MTMMTMMMNTPILLPPEQLSSQAFSESRDRGYAMHESKYAQ
jgi:hypothetical protein